MRAPRTLLAMLCSASLAAPAAAGEWYEALESSTIVYPPNINQSVSSAGAAVGDLAAVKEEIREEVLRSSAQQADLGAVANGSSRSLVMGRSHASASAQAHVPMNRLGDGILSSGPTGVAETGGLSGSGREKHKLMVTAAMSVVDAGQIAPPGSGEGNQNE